MKRIMFLIALLFLVSCTKEEDKKIEVGNLEAFAFQLDKGWELNASAIVKDFKIDKVEDNYKSKLSYYINITQPDSSIVEEADYGIIDISESEEKNEHQLNIQIEFDSGFGSGNYEMLLIVMDDLSGEQDSIATKFELSDE